MTFIVEVTLRLLLQQFNYNNHYITRSEDHYYTVIITTKLWFTAFYHFSSEDEVVIVVNSLLSIHYLCSEHHLLKSVRVHFAPASNGRSFPLEYS